MNSAPRLRAFAHAVSWLSLAGLAGRAISLVTMPVLTVLLSPVAYGEAALVATAISLCSVVTLAGIDMSYSRHWVSGQIAPPDTVEAYCWRWAMGASTAMVAAVCVPLYLYWPAGSSSRGLLVAFVCVGLVGATINTMLQTRARLHGRFAALATAQMGSALGAAAVSLATAYWWRQDALPLLLGAAVATLLPLAWLRPPRLQLLVQSSHLSRAQRRSLFAVGSAGVVTAPAYWVVSSADRWMLAHYQGAEVAGIYSLGAVVGTLGLVVSSAITGTLLPELARAEAATSASYSPGLQPKPDAGQAEHMMWGVLGAVAVMISAVGGELIRALADPRFHGAAALVPWFALGIMFYGCVHLGTARMVLASRLPLVAWAWVVGIVVSLVGNVAAVPHHGAQAAVLVQAAAYGAVMALVWWKVQQHRPLQLQWARILGVMACTLPALAAVGMPWHVNPWWAMAAKTLTALPVALLLMVLAVGSAPFRRLLTRT